MFKQTKTVVLIGLLALLLPAISTAQTCKTASILASTPTSQFTDHKNGTVTDNKTGLMWKKCSEGQAWNKGTGGCDGRGLGYTWQGALISVQKLNNSGGFAGKTDWRVPNIQELASILEDQCESPAINLTVFPATPSDDWFWSSSPVAYDRFSARAVGFDSGNDYEPSKYNNYQVRLVRSAQ